MSGHQVVPVDVPCAVAPVDNRHMEAKRRTAGRSPTLPVASAHALEGR